MYAECTLCEHFIVMKKQEKARKDIVFSDFSTIAGAVGIEPTSTVLETAVLPLNYAPIELTSDIIARHFLILQALFLLFYINLFFLRSLRFSIERGANIVFLPINPMILVI